MRDGVYLVSLGTWVGVCCVLGLTVTMVELLHGKMIMMEKDAQVPPAAIALDI